MEKARKNNKGFSLVELIVVVLIIAIIAVALAPQVMKYVGKARTGTDANNAATIKSAVQVAVADYQSKGFELNEKTTAGAATTKNTFKLTPGTGDGKVESVGSGTAVGNKDEMVKCIEETTGKDIPTPIKESNKLWKVTIDGTGVVTVEAVASIS